MIGVQLCQKLPVEDFRVDICTMGVGFENISAPEPTSSVPLMDKTPHDSSAPLMSVHSFYRTIIGAFFTVSSFSRRQIDV